MKKHTIAHILMVGGMAGSVLFAGTASAIDWNITGFVRQEIAYSLNSDGNPNNDMDNPFNDRVQPMMTHSNFGTAADTARAIAANPENYTQTQLLPGAGFANARSNAHTYWGQQPVGDGSLVPAPRGITPQAQTAFGSAAVNAQFHAAGSNTS